MFQLAIGSFLDPFSILLERCHPLYTKRFDILINVIITIHGDDLDIIRPIFGIQVEGGLAMSDFDNCKNNFIYIYIYISSICTKSISQFDSMKAAFTSLLLVGCWRSSKSSFIIYLSLPPDLAIATHIYYHTLRANKTPSYVVPIILILSFSPTNWLLCWGIYLFDSLCFTYAIYFEMSLSYTKCNVTLLNNFFIKNEIDKFIVRLHYLYLFSILGKFQDNQRSIII